MPPPRFLEMNEKTQPDEFVKVSTNLLSVLVVVLVLAFPNSYLWKKLLVPVFNLPALSYWQMVGFEVFVFLFSRIARL